MIQEHFQSFKRGVGWCYCCTYSVTVHIIQVILMFSSKLRKIPQA